MTCHKDTYLHCFLLQTAFLSSLLLGFALFVVMQQAIPNERQMSSGSPYGIIIRLRFPEGYKAGIYFSAVKLTHCFQLLFLLQKTRIKEVREALNAKTCEKRSKKIAGQKVGPDRLKITDANQKFPVSLSPTTHFAKFKKHKNNTNLQPSRNR